MAKKYTSWVLEFCSTGSKDTMSDSQRNQEPPEKVPNKQIWEI